MIKKIIFLDFDGVLTTDAYLSSLEDEQRCDRYGFVFNPVCVEALGNLLEKIEAEIVITSSWINDMSLWRGRRMWKYRNMPGKILDILRNDSMDRGWKIDLWLSNHGNPEYLIVDDMDERQFLAKQKEHLITTNGHVGLTINDVKLIDF